MNAPDFWFKAVDDYLAYRRNLGVALRTEAGQLRNFAQFATQSDAARLTLALAESWARAIPRPNALTSARRIEVLRGFARFLKRQDPDTVLPPSGLFGPAHRRRVPHIFTENELQELVEATHDLPPDGGFRAMTCPAVLGLLATTGLRIGEAVRLTRADVDLTRGLLAVREAKRHTCRDVPLHETVRAELSAYVQHRDRRVPFPKSEGFFLWESGRSITARQIRYAFHEILDKLGWTPRGDYARHRLHDLRHTFIVRSLMQAYQRNGEVGSEALSLSTYVGHARVTDTYWYLTGVPELMAMAANRFHQYAVEGRP